MIAFKSFAFLAALAASARGADSITHECMMTTDEFGERGRTEGIEFVSNMEDIVNIGEKVLFTRTTDVYVCHGLNAIHGVRVAI